MMRYWHISSPAKAVGEGFIRFKLPNRRWMWKYRESPIEAGRPDKQFCINALVFQFIVLFSDVFLAIDSYETKTF